MSMERGEEREGMAAHLMAWYACLIPFSLEGLGSFRMKRLVVAIREFKRNKRI